MRAVLAVCLLGVAHGLLCSEYSGKKCRLVGCGMVGAGDAVCEHGACKCNPGNCAYAGYCQKPAGCDKRTHGTCRMFPCGNSRGWTDCKNGFCECQADACSVSGKCEKACDYRTGGTCSAFSCAESRHATCQSPGADYWGPHGFRCICKEGDCTAWDGAKGECHKGWDVQSTALNSTEMIAMEQANKPKLNLATTENPFLALPAVCGYVMFGVSVGFVLIRRTWARSIIPPEAMLG